MVVGGREKILAGIKKDTREEGVATEAWRGRVSELKIEN